MKTTLRKPDLTTIINQRLKHQSTRTHIDEEFGLYLPSADYLKKNQVFLKTFHAWPENKQKRFISLLGGRVNFELTESYLVDIIKGER